MTFTEYGTMSAETKEEDKKLTQKKHPSKTQNKGNHGRRRMSSNVSESQKGIFKNAGKGVADSKGLIVEIKTKQRVEKEKRRKLALLAQQKSQICKRFATAGMKQDNAENFAAVILMQEEQKADKAKEDGLVKKLIAHAMDSEEDLAETSSDDDSSGSDDNNDYGLEQEVFHAGSTYFDIFDSLMSRYVTELND